MISLFIASALSAASVEVMGSALGRVGTKTEWSAIIAGVVGPNSSEGVSRIAAAIAAERRTSTTRSRVLSRNWRSRNPLEHLDRLQRLDGPAPPSPGQGG